MSERAILDWYGLRTRETWERAIISLDSARRLARDRYFVKDEDGEPWAASCWVHEISGVMKLFVADYPNGRRLIVRYTGNNNVTISRTNTPLVQHRQLAEENAALADTHPQGGDVEQAPSLMSGAVGAAETPNPSGPPIENIP